MSQFAGTARRITAGEIVAAAKSLGCEYAVLRAVMAVESRNSGYDGRGRPIILFEPHVFYRCLSGEKRARAVRAGLAYAKWGTQKYPSSSDGNYDRLARAIDIDEEAAYRAISVGLPQVLGENYRVAGCSSAKQMFEQAKESEANQLGHMIGFIKGNGLADELRSRNWSAFARRYNGPGQVAKYSAWLEREYRKWRSQPVPAAGAPTSAHDAPTGALPVLRIGDHGNDVKKLQGALAISADGHFGPITQAAVEAFQRANGLDDDGIVGPLTWEALNKKAAA